MPRFAANLSTMLTEVPFAARFAAARALGFRAVEYLFPYDVSPRVFRELLDAAGLELVLINTAPGDRAAGEFGLAALPGREAEFRSQFEQALDYADALGAAMIHVMAGVVPPGVGRERCVSVFVDNLRTAASLARQRGVRLLLEPLNRRDVPRYLHASVAETRAIIEQIGHANVQLQFDCYHLQITQGDLGASLRENLDVIGHVQFSSVPGRHEPQFGEVNMPWLFDLLDALGYRGWIGCEYTPKTTTAAGLDWGAAYGLGPQATTAGKRQSKSV